MEQYLFLLCFMGPCNHFTTTPKKIRTQIVSLSFSHFVPHFVPFFKNASFHLTSRFQLHSLHFTLHLFFLAVFMLLPVRPVLCAMSRPFSIQFLSNPSSGFIVPLIPPSPIILPSATSLRPFNFQSSECQFFLSIKRE